MAGQFLPASLQERLRPQHGATLPAPRDAGAHVLYCMRTAYRSAANPSLETALRVANELRVPLLCLAVLEDSFPAGLAPLPAVQLRWFPPEIVGHTYSGVYVPFLYASAGLLAADASLAFSEGDSRSSGW